jgi:hypothetical protein
VWRDADGAGLLIAMAPLPATAHFPEVRGPRNALVNLAHVDKLRLARAIGMKPRTPPPPAPPRPSRLDVHPEIELLRALALMRAAAS